MAFHLLNLPKNKMDDQYLISALPRSLDYTRLIETYQTFISRSEEKLIEDLEDVINFCDLEDLDENAVKADKFSRIPSGVVKAPTDEMTPMERLLAASAFGDDMDTRIWVKDYLFRVFSDALTFTGAGCFYAVFAPTLGGIILVRSSSYETACRVARDRLARVRRIFSPAMFRDISNQHLQRRLGLTAFT